MKVVIDTPSQSVGLFMNIPTLPFQALVGCAPTPSWKLARLWACFGEWRIRETQRNFWPNRWPVHTHPHSLSPPPLCCDNRECSESRCSASWVSECRQRGAEPLADPYGAQAFCALLFVSWAPEICAVCSWSISQLILTNKMATKILSSSNLGCKNTRTSSSPRVGSVLILPWEGITCDVEQWEVTQPHPGYRAQVTGEDGRGQEKDKVHFEWSLLCCSFRYSFRQSYPQITASVATLKFPHCPFLWVRYSIA